MDNWERHATPLECQHHFSCVWLSHKKITWSQKFSFQWQVPTSLDLFQKYSLICLTLKDVMKASNKEETFHSNIMMVILGLFLYQRMKKRLGSKPILFINNGWLSKSWWNDLKKDHLRKNYLISFNSMINCHWKNFLK